MAESHSWYVNPLPLYSTQSNNATQQSREYGRWKMRPDPKNNEKYWDWVDESLNAVRKRTGSNQMNVDK
jgi:hypothetical protein